MHSHANALAIALVILAIGTTVVFAQEEELPDLNPGEGWAESEATTRTGLSARSWEDPAAGCFSVLFALDVPSTAGVDIIAQSFSEALSKAAITATKATGPGDRAYELSGGGLDGLARLDLSGGEPKRASLLACYWNEREPRQCKAICTRTLQSAP